MSKHITDNSLRRINAGCEALYYINLIIQMLLYTVFHGWFSRYIYEKPSGLSLFSILMSIFPDIVQSYPPIDGVANFTYEIIPSKYSVQKKLICGEYLKLIPQLDMQENRCKQWSKLAL